MVRVLFVCLGNICRSPAAEGVFQHMLEKNHLTDKIECDSAGTSAYHKGEPADGRMRAHAKERGYDLTSRSRPFIAPDDFENFDWIVTMDESNYLNVIKLTANQTYRNKVVRMTDFCTIHDIEEVPDPYAGGSDGFELVMDIVEDGCHGLLKKLEFNR